MDINETKMLLHCLDNNCIELARLYLISNIEKNYEFNAKQAYKEYVFNSSDLISGYYNNNYIFSNYKSIYSLQSDKILSEYVKKTNRECLFDNKEKLMNKLFYLNKCLNKAQSHAKNKVNNVIINNDKVELYSKDKSSIIEYQEYLYLNKILDEDLNLYITDYNNYCYAVSSRGKSLILTKESN